MQIELIGVRSEVDLHYEIVMFAVLRLPITYELKKNRIKSSLSGIRSEYDNLKTIYCGWQIIERCVIYDVSQQSLVFSLCMAQ